MANIKNIIVGTVATATVGATAFLISKAIKAKHMTDTKAEEMNNAQNTDTESADFNPQIINKKTGEVLSDEDATKVIEKAQSKAQPVKEDIDDDTAMLESACDASFVSDDQPYVVKLTEEEKAEKLFEENFEPIVRQIMESDYDKSLWEYHKDYLYGLFHEIMAYVGRTHKVSAQADADLCAIEKIMKEKKEKEEA